ncbi:MAG: glycogen synthase [Anaerolineae bacterium]|nr:glycogen synthase [Anaerolineae bacterium]
MNVLFISTEADPFAKVGGLADVVGSLPKALRALGVDARVLMPFYGFIDPNRFGIDYLFSFEHTNRRGTTHVDIFSTERDGVPFYFMRALPFFGGESTVYSDWDGDMPRFIFFCLAALDAVVHLRGRTGFFPDVLHVNDWHTGAIPFLVDNRRLYDPEWRSVGIVLSIHNMQYQGEYCGGWMFEYGVPGRRHPELERLGFIDNMLGMSIAFSDIVSTVSPRYASEIQFSFMGFGLDPLIRSRAPDLHGILNGMDIDMWDPATDKMLVSNFSADDFREKRPANKAQLQAEVGLPVRDDVLLVGMVTRLVEQKGLDLAFPALRTILNDTDIQFVGLGSGEKHYNDDLADIGSRYPGKARSYVGFNAAIAQRIYGGCDLFLMPSHFEPCGVGQMIAMRYGALPLVRETGGLADTVANYDNGDAETGTGFVFQWQEWQAVLGTLRWANETFHTRKAAWARMQERAMRRDFSWDTSAREYIRQYEEARRRHSG